MKRVGVVVLLWCGFVFPAVGQCDPLCLKSDLFAGLFPTGWEDFEPETTKINTENADPLDPGHMELEFGYTHNRAHSVWDNRWDEKPRMLLEEKIYDFSLSYGLFEDWEIGAGIGYSQLTDKEFGIHRDEMHIPPHISSGGIGDLEIGFKYRFYEDEETHLRLAYVPSVVIPTGKKGTVRDPLGHSQEYWTFDQRLVATKTWGRANLNWDLGYSLPIGQKRQDERGHLDTNLAFGYHILPWLQPEIELNYGHDFIDAGPDADVVAITFGLMMPLSDKWRAAAGVQQALYGRNTDHTSTGFLALTYIY